MAKLLHKNRRKAVETVARKARARRSVSVMKSEYLAEIERFRLMDDDFMSKCLENAPECIELILQIILGKKDLKVVRSQTEYPIKSSSPVRTSASCATRMSSSSPSLM